MRQLGILTALFILMAVVALFFSREKMTRDGLDLRVQNRSGDLVVTNNSALTVSDCAVVLNGSFKRLDMNFPPDDPVHLMGRSFVTDGGVQFDPSAVNLQRIHISCRKPKIAEASFAP